jgi:hypothetical protein
MKMKNLVYIGFALAILIACDKVKNPNQNPDAVSNCVITPHVIKTNSLTSNFRKVLVEDYTGHTCGNCPSAARNLEGKETLYKDSLIVMAVHAGNAYAPPQLPDYPDDFRTPSSNDWDQFLGIAGFNPRVCINRAQNPYPQSPGTLTSLIPLNLHKTQSVKLDVTTYFDTVKYYLNVKVKSTFKTALTNSVKLVLVMVQDSIIAHQKDYSPATSANLCAVGSESLECVCNYVFNGVCRGTINGSWGDLVKAGPIAANDTTSNYTSCYKVNPYQNVMSNVKHMSVLAYAYDDVTKEILQTERVKIK